MIDDGTKLMQRIGQLESARRAVIATADGGRGVLVAGGLILTASHCLHWTPDDAGEAMFDADGRQIVDARTHDGAELKLGVLFNDPVADIAALGCLDDDFGPDAVSEFEQWLEVTQYVPLFRGAVPERFRRGNLIADPATIAVMALALDGRWVDGRASILGDERTAPKVYLELENDTEVGQR